MHTSYSDSIGYLSTKSIWLQISYLISAPIQRKIFNCFAQTLHKHALRTLRQLIIRHHVVVHIRIYYTSSQL